MVSDTRYSLLRGWARYLALWAEELHTESQRIVKRRGSNFGILIHEDLEACRYQRLHFRLRRAKYAVGMFGLISKVTITIKDRRVATKEEIAEDNRVAMSRVREQATKAKRILESANALSEPLDPRDYYDYPA